MSNEMPTNPSGEEREEIGNTERVVEWLAKHPDLIVFPESSKELEAIIAEFEVIINLFEQRHSLEALHSIIELSPNLNLLFVKSRDMSDGEIESEIEALTQRDAEIYRIRTSAKKDLEPITELLKKIPPKYSELKEKYMKLSRAVGMINGGKIDHTR